MKRYIWLWIVLIGSAVSTTPAAAIDWLGGGADNDWSTVGNWSGGDIDPTGDALYYDATDMTTLGMVNGVVDSSDNVASMRFLNLSATGTEGHTIDIPAGTTLTVSGTTDIGFHWSGAWTDPNNANNKNYVTAMFTGGGQMVINGRLRIENSGSGTPPAPATLDVSGLSQFTVDTTSNIELGGRNYGRGQLVLSGDNLLKASGIYVPGLATAYTSNPQLSSMYLGQQNTFNANTIHVGRSGLRGEILFQGGLSDPELTIRDYAGTGRADLHIGHFQGAYHRTITGTVDLSDGSVDALLDEFYLGIGNLGNGNTYSEGVTGTFSMTAGSVDAVDVVLGRVAGDHTPSSTPKWSQGILNIGGGTFAAQTFTMGDDDADNQDNVRGTINLSGGTLSAGTIQKGDGNGQAVFNWTGGTLSVDSFGFDLVQDNTDSQSTLAPGRSIGITAIDGDYQMDAGILQIEIDPILPENDLITVSGQATLSGQLDVILSDSNVPLGTFFDVLTAGGGITDNLTLIGDRPDGYFWGTQVLGQAGGQVLRLTAVPEPSTAILAALGLLGLGFARRRR